MSQRHAGTSAKKDRATSAGAQKYKWMLILSLVTGQILPLMIYPLEDWKVPHAQLGGTSAHTVNP